MVRASRSPYAPMPTVASDDQRDGDDVVGTASRAHDRSTSSTKSRSCRSASRTWSQPAGEQRGVDEPAEQQPRQRQPEHAGRAGARDQGEQQRQAAEQHDEHGEQAQGEAELGAHERADEQLADEVLLVEGLQGRAAGRPAYRPRAGDPHPLRRCLTGLGLAAPGAPGGP